MRYIYISHNEIRVISYLVAGLYNAYKPLKHVIYICTNVLKNLIAIYYFLL